MPATPQRRPFPPSPSAPTAARMMVAALVGVGMVARLTPALMMLPERAARLPLAHPYLRLALALAEGEGFVLRRPPPGNGAAGDRLYRAARLPGYPAVVAAAKRWLDAPARGPLVLQAVAGAGGIALAAWAAWRLGGPWAGAAAAALTAFDPLAVACSALFTPTALVAPAMAAAAAAGVGYLGAVDAGRRAWPWALAAGLALAAAAYVEVWPLALVPVAGAAALLGRRRRRYLAGWALGTAVVAAALSPWIARNLREAATPMPETDLARRIWAATTGSETPSPDGEAAPADISPGAAAPVRPPSGLDEAAEARFYLRAAAARAAEAPGRWLAGVAERAARFWSPALPPGLGPTDPQGRPGPLHPVAGYVSLVPTAGLALVGLVVLRRRAAAWWLALAAVAATAGYAVGLSDWTGERVAVGAALAALGGAGLGRLLGGPDHRKGDQTKGPAEAPDGPGAGPPQEAERPRAGPERED